ncbi:hypothetical protein ACFQ71_24550 [Streptomyces sp. NPDC056534]|uniref:hypothetical protein n=1 Tax=Streptomyces sp. NPDC056534 TaxID=3345857 RepID=UPI00369932F4
MDHSAPYDCAWSGDGSSHCIQVPLDQLTLYVDVVRRALPHLTASPLYPMVTDHVAHLTGSIDDLLDEPASAGIEEIAIGLTRTQVASAVRQDDRTRTVLAETGLTRIRAYVQRHLTDPGLRPARIAAAHHISERHPYNLCAQSGFSLTRWIASPGHRDRPLVGEPTTEHPLLSALVRVPHSSVCPARPPAFKPVFAPGQHSEPAARDRPLPAPTHQCAGAPLRR